MSFSMPYRTLGKTGLRVSVLGFGASPLGGVFAPIDETVGIRAVHEAVERGVNFFDVAPYYGLTKAETVLGKALREIPREKFILATKVGRYGAKSKDFDFSAARVTRSVDESLQRLQVDHVDLIQCHDIEFGSLDQVIEETLPALRRVRDQGKARFIGITGLPLKIFRYVLKHADVDTVLSYCHYSLNDSSLVELLPLLQEKGVGIISASPFSMGLLTEQGPPDWHPAPVEIKAACARAAAHCKKRGTDISRLAMQFAFANPSIHTTLVGMSRPDHLKRNLECLGQSPDPQLLAEVQEILKPVYNRSWPTGRPENN